MSDKKLKKVTTAEKQATTKNRLVVEYYKTPRIRSTWFLTGLIIGYLPYLYHQGFFGVFS
jgi:hypothetical protein|tara:strand:- start:48 stop:227 length:180 start_codon:yes stop_codon:yes gene_type:complete